MSVARTGDLIGATALFTQVQRAANATAREPSVVIRLTQQVMRRVLEEYPHAAAGMHAVLAQDLETLARDLVRVGRRLN